MIPKYAFSGASQYGFLSSYLEKITFTKECKTIENQAFEYCSLNELELPPLVEHIGANAFARNRGITSLKKRFAPEHPIFSLASSKVLSRFFNAPDTYKNTRGYSWRHNTSIIPPKPYMFGNLIPVRFFTKFVISPFLPNRRIHE